MKNDTYCPKGSIIKEPLASYDDQPAAGVSSKLIFLMAWALLKSSSIVTAMAPMIAFFLLCITKSFCLNMTMQRTLSCFELVFAKHLQNCWLSSTPLRARSRVLLSLLQLLDPFLYCFRGETDLLTPVWPLPWTAFSGTEAFKSSSEPEEICYLKIAPCCIFD